MGAFLIGVVRSGAVVVLEEGRSLLLTGSSLLGAEPSLC